MGLSRREPGPARSPGSNRHRGRLRPLPLDTQPVGALGGLAAARGGGHDPGRACAGSRRSPGGARRSRARAGGDTTGAEHAPQAEDAATTLAAVEQGKGVGLARWSLVASDLAAGRLARPMPLAVHQHNAWFLAAPPDAFALPKVVRFRAWLAEGRQGVGAA